MQPPPPPPSASPPAPSGSPPPSGESQPPGWIPPLPIHPRARWIWGCAGCAALALVAIAVLVFIVLRIFTSSPLRQFPTQAGAVTTEDNFASANNRTTETLSMVDAHSLTDAESFYQQALHANGWTTDTRDPAQASSGDRWSVGRSDSPTQRGSITFTTAGANTDIAVVFSY